MEIKNVVDMSFEEFNELQTGAIVRIRDLEFELRSSGLIDGNAKTKFYLTLMRSNQKELEEMYMASYDAYDRMEYSAVFKHVRKNTCAIFTKEEMYKMIVSNDFSIS
jgi:hypothetical protein